MCRAENSKTRPERSAEGPALSGAPMSIATPCWTRRLAIVAMSARSGRLARTSGSPVNRLAAISGSAAFLAPPMLIVPDSGTPPRIRILSIFSAPGGDDRPHRVPAGARPGRTGCFYGRVPRCSSRRLVVGRIRRPVGGALLPGAGLFLAAPQIVAQCVREARLASGDLNALGAGDTG